MRHGMNNNLPLPQNTPLISYLDCDYFSMTCYDNMPLIYDKLKKKREKKKKDHSLYFRNSIE